MNIYALKGFKVRITGFTGGLHSGDRETTQRHLEIGKEYTVERTKVHSWHTEYYFQEAPDIAFSAFICDDISTQSAEEDKKHPDYAKYNS